MLRTSVLVGHLDGYLAVLEIREDQVVLVVGLGVREQIVEGVVLEVVRGPEPRVGKVRGQRIGEACAEVR
ncbi:hypothetical protein [Streptodolium elevatio]|uniref:Uncharacterized protein n=1 Tax=Streptodolium elevatio TaxID=3157996 RepID=A0ABV3DKP2_9ACTN